MERTQDFDVPAEELWAAVTDPGGMGWLGDDVSLDLQPGGTGRITDAGETREVAIDEVDPGHRLSFRWWPEGEEDLTSRVDLIVVPHPPGSRLVVRESLPAPLAPPVLLHGAAGLATGAGWRRVRTGLPGGTGSSAGVQGRPGAVTLVSGRPGAPGVVSSGPGAATALFSGSGPTTVAVDGGDGAGGLAAVRFLACSRQPGQMPVARRAAAWDRRLLVLGLSALRPAAAAGAR